MASGRLTLPPPNDALLGLWKDLLESKLKFAYGRATLTWPGGVNFTNALQITHGIDVKGSSYGAILTQPTGGVTTTGAPYIAIAGVGATTTQIQVQAYTINGSNPAASTNDIFWLVIVQ